MSRLPPNNRDGDVSIKVKSCDTQNVDGIAKLWYEFKILRKLDGHVNGVCRPISLDRNRLVLPLAPGQQSLRARYCLDPSSASAAVPLRRPRQFDRAFLAMAQKAARILHDLHSRKIVHKNIT